MTTDPADTARRLDQHGADIVEIYTIVGRIEDVQKTHTSQLQRLDERLGDHDLRFDAVDRRFDGIDQRLDGMDRRFDGIDQRLDGIDQQLGSVQAQLGDVLGILREGRG